MRIKKLWGDIKGYGNQAESCPKERWLDIGMLYGDNGIGEGRLPRMDAIIGSMGEYKLEGDTDEVRRKRMLAVMEFVTSHPSWVKAERMFGKGMLQRLLEGARVPDGLASDDGLIARTFHLFQKALYSPADGSLYFRTWEFDARNNMADLRKELDGYDAESGQGWENPDHSGTDVVSQLKEMELVTLVDGQLKGRVKDKSGKVDKLAEYFTSDTRVDYNALFLAAKHMHGICTRGQAINKETAAFLEVEDIRQRLVMSETMRDVVFDSDCRKVHYLPPDHVPEQLTIDAQCTGSLRRVPLSVITKMRRTTSTGGLASNESGNELSLNLNQMENSDFLNQAMVNAELFHVYVFNSCMLCTTSVEFAIDDTLTARKSATDVSAWHDDQPAMGETKETDFGQSVSQEVAHFVLRFPLKYISGSGGGEHREPVVIFKAIPNSFMVKCVDCKGEPQHHVFSCESQEQCDNWVSLLNHQSIRYERVVGIDAEVARDEPMIVDKRAVKAQRTLKKAERDLAAVQAELQQKRIEASTTGNVSAQELRQMEQKELLARQTVEAKQIQMDDIEGMEHSSLLGPKSSAEFEVGQVVHVVGEQAALRWHVTRVFVQDSSFWYELLSDSATDTPLAVKRQTELELAEGDEDVPASSDGLAKTFTAGQLQQPFAPSRTASAQRRASDGVSMHEFSKATQYARQRFLRCRPRLLPVAGNNSHRQSFLSCCLPLQG